jgi:hypothetical protein
MRITLSTAQAVTLAKAIKPAIGTDPIRNHLMTVEIAATDGGATFTATDGYRMHQVTVAAANGWAYEPGEKINVAGKELVANLALLAKTNGTGDGTVTLANETEDRSQILNLMMTSSSSMVVVVDEIAREFPNCGAILNTEPATSELVCQFDSEYLADIITAAGVVGKIKKSKGIEATSPIKILNLNPSKPCHITATNADMGMEFYGVIMPQRP